MLGRVARRWGATVGCWLASWAQQVLQASADTGQQVLVRITVYQEIPGQEPEVVFSDDAALTEAVMSRLPAVRRNGGDN